MAERTLILHRYCRDNWPQVRGLRPFIAQGPRFKEYTTTKAIEYEWKFRPVLYDDIMSIGESADQLSREIVAELFLREGIVTALWSTGSPDIISTERRWRESIEQVAREIPNATPLAEWVIEFLSGLSTPNHFTNYLSDDGLALHPVTVPDEV